MKKNKIVFCALSACGLILVACSHKSIDKELDRKVAQETQINTQADLNAESERLIESAPGLTPTQRTQLIALRESTRAATQEQTKESLRLRSVLVKDLLSSNFNRQEVAVLKNKIKKTDQAKLSILMDSIRKTNLILGRHAKDDYSERDYDYIIHDFNFERRSN